MASGPPNYDDYIGFNRETCQPWRQHHHDLGTKRQCEAVRVPVLVPQFRIGDKSFCGDRQLNLDQQTTFLIVFLH